MKRIIFSMLTIALVGFWSGCAQDSDLNPIVEGSTVSTSMDDNVEQVPDAVLAYIAANYPAATILSIETESEDDNAVTYEVYLSDGTEVYFDADGNFLLDETSTDSDDSDVVVTDLPQAILDYVAANYPDAVIESANGEDNGAIEVELSTGLDLYFDADGNFIGANTDEDGNDDSSSGSGDDTGDDSGNDDVALTDLPQAILDYVAANYPDASIESAHTEDNGSFEVELNSGVDLHFDADGNFIG